jgi:hypothetical protein
VLFSEEEKAIRGSILSLQLINASASVLVLIGKSVQLKSKVNKLIKRYSYLRYRIWTEKDIEQLYKEIKK